MCNILSLWPPGKSLASQLIATLLWILKVCHPVGCQGQFGKGSHLDFFKGFPKCLQRIPASNAWREYPSVIPATNTCQ